MVDWARCLGALSGRTARSRRGRHSRTARTVVATLALAVLAGCTGGGDDVIVMQSDSTYWPWETSPPTSTPPPVAPAANATASVSPGPMTPAPTETAAPPASNTPSSGEPAPPSSEPPSTGAEPGPTTPPGGGNIPTRKLANDIVTLTNVEREIAGCPPVSNNRILRNVASAHSADMAEHDFFSHINPDGEGPADRVKAAGYKGFTGENIAMGYNSAEAVVAAWMDSQDHRNIILNCESKVVGVGVADSPRGLYWTQLFGRS